jgi:hypothetical protein
MQILRENFGRMIRLTDERFNHLESQHPEMANQLNNIADTIADPDRIIRSQNDAVMEKIDDEGNIIGFSILKVSGLKEQKPLSIILKEQIA